MTSLEEIPSLPQERKRANPSGFQVRVVGFMGSYTDYLMWKGCSAADLLRAISRKTGISENCLILRNGNSLVEPTHLIAEPSSFRIHIDTKN
jgi:hypothetical protein